jgi:Ni,Fe-hydrogenase III small subunit/NAD-dependent dihydropyrimidine dehydrogenase PreA subunit
VEIEFGRCRLEGACVEACPADAITLERFAKGARLRLDHGRCVFCGLCEEACGEGALRQGRRFELAARQRADLVSEGCYGEAPREPDAASAPEESEREAARLRLARSIAVRVVDAGDCGGCLAEVAAGFGPVHDLGQFGIELVASPRQADLLLVTGPITVAMAAALELAWRQMPGPRLVAALGACAISGGVYHAAPGQTGGLRTVPVDLWIPGCPPRPQAIAHALRLLVGRAEPRQRALHWSGALPGDGQPERAR